MVSAGVAHELQWINEKIEKLKSGLASNVKLAADHPSYLRSESRNLPGLAEAIAFDPVMMDEVQKYPNLISLLKKELEHSSGRWKAQLESIEQIKFELDEAKDSDRFNELAKLQGQVTLFETLKATGQGPQGLSEIQKALQDEYALVAATKQRAGDKMGDYVPLFDKQAESLDAKLKNTSFFAVSAHQEIKEEAEKLMDKVNRLPFFGADSQKLLITRCEAIIDLAFKSALKGVAIIAGGTVTVAGVAYGIYKKLFAKEKKVEDYDGWLKD